ncbi:hypothetical protein QQF64_005690, partial [Cirrhinus molitorella]
EPSVRSHTHPGAEPTWTPLVLPQRCLGSHLDEVVLFTQGCLEREGEKCTMDAGATVCDSNEGWLGQEGGSTGTALREDNAGPPLCFRSGHGAFRKVMEQSRLSDSFSCVCLALCVRCAGGEMDSTRLPAPTSHPASLLTAQLSQTAALQHPLLNCYA